MQPKGSFLQFPSADEFLKASNACSPDYLAPGSLRMTFKMKQVMENGQERRVPDTYDCDCMFIRHFTTPEMSMDFPAIAGEFLKHEYIHLDQYLKHTLMTTSPNADAPTKVLEYHILGLILSAVREESAFARSFLFALYKTYYSKEYKQLRRFTVLTHEAILAMGGNAPDGSFDDAVISRLLTIAPILGITLDPMCLFLYSLITRHIEYDQQEMHQLTEPVTFSDELQQQCHSIIQTGLSQAKRPFFKSHISRPFRNAEQLLSLTLRYFGYPEDYFLRCCPHFLKDLKDNCISNMTTTLALLKTQFPGTGFSLNDIQLYSFIFRLVEFLCKQNELFFEYLRNIRETGAYTNYSDIFPAFMEECKETKIPNTGVALTVNSTPTADDSTSAANSALAADSTSAMNSTPATANTITEKNASIYALQERLKKKDLDLAHLKERYSIVRNKLQEYENVIEQYKNEHMELIALREHVYQWTEGDASEEPEDFEAMTSAIASKRIIIIGGHSNWIGKIRNKFSNWVFVSPKVTATVDVNIIMKADYVYFFSNCIQHSTYYRFIKALREHKRPFGYIHSINIRSNIQQIWKDIYEGEN